MACNTIDEFITYTIDSGAVTKLYIDSENLRGVPLSSGLIQINNIFLGDPPNSLDRFVANVPNEIGSYSISEEQSIGEINMTLRFQENGGAYVYSLPSSFLGNNIIINVNKTAENPGDFIDINFSGEIFFSTGIIRTVVGSAHVKKTE